STDSHVLTSLPCGHAPPEKAELPTRTEATWFVPICSPPDGSFSPVNVTVVAVPGYTVPPVEPWRVTEALVPTEPVPVPEPVAVRSEERRVGRECGPRRPRVDCIHYRLVRDMKTADD